MYTPNEITDCCVSYRRSKKYISSSIRTEHTIFGRNGWQEEQSCTSTDCKNEMKISLFMPVSLNPQWLVCKYHSAFGKEGFVMFSIAPTGEWWARLRTVRFLYENQQRLSLILSPITRFYLLCLFLLWEERLHRCEAAAQFHYSCQTLCIAKNKTTKKNM